MQVPAEDRELRRTRRLAHANGPIAAILAKMAPEGYWVRPGSGYNPKYRSGVWSLILLAQLGASIEEDKRIETAIGFYLDHALAPAGQISSTTGPGGTIDCLQGNMLWALTQLGCEDARLKPAVEWTARSVTGEGVAPPEERSAPLRWYAYKCGPLFACGVNDKRACAWGGVKVVLALASLPGRPSPLIRRALTQVPSTCSKGIPPGHSTPRAMAASPAAIGGSSASRSST
jgi:hypothetical protein